MATRGRQIWIVTVALGPAIAGCSGRDPGDGAGDVRQRSAALATTHYSVAPSDTDEQFAGVTPCFPGDVTRGIGCEMNWPIGKETSAPDAAHIFYAPADQDRKLSGNLLVFFAGAPGNADSRTSSFYETAVSRGYHLLALTIYDAGLNPCRSPRCFEVSLHEAVTGEAPDADDAKFSTSDMHEHPQDSVLSRLQHALIWAIVNHPEDGWSRYLRKDGIFWERVAFAGFSGGSSFASYLGTQFPTTARVALLAGPNDGVGDSPETWKVARYIKTIPGVTDEHYYGLVHYLNWAGASPSVPYPVFQVIDAWQAFGMSGVSDFDPHGSPLPDGAPDFGGGHMLVSMDPRTGGCWAHPSVIFNTYRTCNPQGDDCNCQDDDHGDIGYEPAWRCILGTGDAWASQAPVANAGKYKSAECQNGGAIVVLDGSGSRDDDCDAHYVWTGPFQPGWASGRNPQVFLPLPLGTSLGTNYVTLRLDDPWMTSTDTAQIKVVDSKPPEMKCPDVNTFAATSSGAVVNFPVTATDACSYATKPVCTIPSGSTFPVGTRTVTCSTQDAAGQVASCTFDVTVTVAPFAKTVLTLP